jgi:hypothetical protein
MYSAPRKPLAERLWAKVKEGSTQPHMTTPCRLWTGSVLKNGYGSIGSGGHDGKTLYVHVAAFELQHGPVPPGLMVLHECDVKLCVVHVYAGTRADNARDAVLRGRMASGDWNGSRTHPETVPRGSARPNAKYTEELVMTWREEYRSGTTQKALCEKYGVPSGMMSMALRGKRWAHIPGATP